MLFEIFFRKAIMFKKEEHYFPSRSASLFSIFFIFSSHEVLHHRPLIPMPRPLPAPFPHGPSPLPVPGPSPFGPVHNWAYMMSYEIRYILNIYSLLKECKRFLFLSVFIGERDRISLWGVTSLPAIIF